MADYICNGSFSSGSVLRYKLSDIQGEKIIISEWIDVSGTGEFELITDGKKAAIVAEGTAIFGDGGIVDRTYVLASIGGEYATLLNIEATGAALYRARPMIGSANFLEMKCQKI